MNASTVVLPAGAPSSSRATTWWGKAWTRAVEESAYAERDLATGRALARAGRIGRISVEPGRFVAAVEDDRGLWAVVGTLPVWEPDAVDALVETVAAQPGRAAALLAGDLPLDLVEHAEESGVELLPTGGELGASCTCRSWTDPCVHALAVLHQLGRRIEVDPALLLHLRGLPRDELLRRVGDRGQIPATEEQDVDVAAEAAWRAARMIAEADQPSS